MGTMDTLMQSQIFFFISSLGFIVLWALLGVLLFYLIRTANTFSRIMTRIESDIEKIGDTTKELLEEFKNSALIHLLNFFFKKKKKTRKDSK